MPAQAISCGDCSWPVPAEWWNREEGVRCPGCGHRVRVVVFPATKRTQAGLLPEALGADTEASCFYHPESRAAVPCDECGRFLCRLCDLEVDGRHLCPACFQTGVVTGRLETVETRRIMYDTVALALSTLPILFWPSLVVTAPWTLFMVFRRWRAPGSVVPRTRIRFYLAALFALAEVVLIGFAVKAIWLMVHLPRSGGGR
jgi:DNA-directed RNA polymerase subunit RPC12/RpoP